MSHPCEGRDYDRPLILNYEILIKPTRQSFRVTIYQGGLSITSKVLFTMDGILRWADMVCQQDAESRGAHHWDATPKLVSL